MIVLIIILGLLLIPINIFSFFVVLSGGPSALFPGFHPWLDILVTILGFPGALLGLLIGIVTFMWTEW